MPSVSSPALSTSVSPIRTSYREFTKAVRAYYGIPVAAEWMARLWTAYKSNVPVADYPALRHLVQSGAVAPFIV